MGQFLHKPKPTQAGFPKAKSASPDSKDVAARNSPSEVSDTSLQEAESRAARKREWVEATQISERRHALLAKLQSGEVSRESIDPAELLILDELARVLREQTSAKRGRARHSDAYGNSYVRSHRGRVGRSRAAHCVPGRSSRVMSASGSEPAVRHDDENCPLADA